jgi:antibiotic biosynthesis monooxygenase
MAVGLCAEIVRVRPKEGAVERLLEIRDEMVQSYRDNFPAFVSCRLLSPADSEEWVDLWFWKTQEDAEHALANTQLTPLFEEWGTLVEMVRFEWAEVLTDH